MPNDRFLLIKLSSGDLWENVYHIVVMRLVAELSGRRPIIFWGTNCLYDGKVYNNAYDLYFEPVSDYSIYDVMDKKFTYYPPIWKHDNLMSDDPDRQSGRYRNIGDMLSSDADVLVSDTNISVKQMVPFIGEEHELYGLTPIYMYRRLIDRYVYLKPNIIKSIKEHCEKVIGKKTVLAVHMPGDFTTGIYPQISAFTKLNIAYHSNLHIGRSDIFEVDETIDQHQNVRILDASKPQDPYKAYNAEIRRVLTKFAINKIYLLTDREDIINEFVDEFGSIVIYKDQDRIAEGDMGNDEQLETFLNKRSKGIEILADTYAATLCSLFIGYGGSSLSHAVTHLRDWPETNFKLHYWVFKKLYNFTYQFVKTGRNAPEEADGRYKLIVKNAENSFKRIASVFK